MRPLRPPAVALNIPATGAEGSYFLMGAVAEAYFYLPDQVHDSQHDMPAAIVVSEMPEDVFSRRKADKLIRLAGSMTVEAAGITSTETADETAAGFDTMMDALHAAKCGSQAGRNVVRMNAMTDVTERTIKAGHVIDVALDVRPDGKVLQHGQLADSVAINALRYASNVPQMRLRAQAEARNNVRIENLNRQGLLKNHYFVVFSRYADDMSKTEAANAGFFVDTMSCAIQVTTASGDGLVMESAFVAGVTPGQASHDQQAVAAVVARLGASYDGLTATQIIDTPLLIPKDLMPDGVIDLVRLYDEAADDTFFGQAKPVQDYLEYRDYCHERQAGFEPAAEAIVKAMIDRADLVKTPVEAVELLNALSQREMVDVAIYDDTIDAQVFGGEAAGFIEQARLLREHGDIEQFQLMRENAQATAQSYSCPSGTSKAGLTEAAAAESDDWHGGKIHRNKACRSCKVTKAEIGACHVCKDCVGKPAKMQAAYNREMAAAKRASIVELALKRSAEARNAESVPDEAASAASGEEPGQGSNVRWLAFAKVTQPQSDELATAA